MPTEKELLHRIEELEHQNSILQDKLDMIYAIIASDQEEPPIDHSEDDEDDDESDLVQIRN